MKEVIFVGLSDLFINKIIRENKISYVIYENLLKEEISIKFLTKKNILVIFGDFFNEDKTIENLLELKKIKSNEIKFIAIVKKRNINYIQKIINNSLVDFLYYRDIKVEENIKNTLNFFIKSDENLIYKRNQMKKQMVTTFFIYDLIYGDMSKIEALEELRQEFNLSNFPNCVLILMIDDFWEICRDFNNKKRYSLKMYCLELVIKALEINEIKGITCSLFGTDKIVILLDNVFKDFSYVKKISYSIKEYMNKNFRYTVTLGVSNVCQNAKLLWKAYEEAFQALNHSFFLKKNEIIFFNQNRVLKIDETLNFDFIEAKFRFFKNISTYSSKEIYDNYLEILEQLLSKKQNKELVKSIIINFSFEIINYLSNLSINKKSLEEKLAEFNLKVLRANFIENLKEIIYDFANKILEATQHIQIENNDFSLNLAVNFINKYYNKTLRLEDVAKLSNMSKDYFSRKFKEKYEKNFLRYIIELRLEKARKLLENKALSVQNISEIVGFKDSGYFSKIFKKKYGISPLYFRKNKIR